MEQNVSKSLLKTNIERTKNNTFLVLFKNDVVEMTQEQIVCLTKFVCNYFRKQTGSFMKLEEINLNHVLCYAETFESIIVESLDYNSTLFNVTYSMNTHEIIAGRIINQLKKI